MKKQNAFTLAEVLITLGIIGVVAAMTLPTLLNSTQASQFRAQFKKTLSVASQAVVVTVALDDYDMGQANSVETGIDNGDENGQGGTGDYYPSLFNMFDRRLNVVGVGEEGSAYAASWTITGDAAEPEGDEEPAADRIGSLSDYHIFYLNDGSTLGIKKTDQGCTADSPCTGFIDVNGPKMPNTVIACNEGTAGDTCKADRAGDVYPILLHDQTIEPGNDAAKWVLYKGGK